MREQFCAQLAAGWAAGLHATVHCQPLDFALLVEKLDTTLDWDAVLTGFTGSCTHRRERDGERYT